MDLRMKFLVISAFVPFVMALNVTEPTESCTKTTGYKPVLIVHGLFNFDKTARFDLMAEYIRRKHPGTQVKVIDLLHGWKSFMTPMWEQVEAFGAVVRQYTKNYPDGVHLIGYSQGGLICRGIIESMSDVKVSTFVSLSAPQAGQFGDAFLLVPNTKYMLRYLGVYSRIGQTFSTANIWNDPYHQDAYLEGCRYLPYIDNVVPSVNSSIYRTNFIKLDHLILIGGPNDQLISPWQSSHFGFYADKNETNVIPMRSRRIYTEDLFGLKTLDEANKIVECNYEGIVHKEWHQNKTVMDECVLPYLT